MKKIIILTVLLFGPMSIMLARSEADLGSRDIRIGQDESMMMEKGEIPDFGALPPKTPDGTEAASATPSTKIGQDKTAGTLSQGLTASKPLYMQDATTRDATGYITTGGVLGTQSYTTGQSLSAESYTAGQSKEIEADLEKEILQEGVLP